MTCREIFAVEGGIVPESTFLEEALHYSSREAREHVADAIYCHLHNTGYQLENNNADNDVEWFAHNLYEKYAGEGCRASWEAYEEQDRWREIARVVIALLPSLQKRIASRLIALSKVMEDIARAERKSIEDARKSRRLKKVG